MNIHNQKPQSGLAFVALTMGSAFACWLVLEGTLWLIRNIFG